MTGGCVALRRDVFEHPLEGRSSSHGRAVSRCSEAPHVAAIQQRQHFATLHRELPVRPVDHP
jgi:hypothetical protein